MNKNNPDIAIIHHTGETFNPPEDLSEYPYKLYANLRPPEFMDFAFIMLYGGSEEIIIRGKSEDALNKVSTELGLPNHPRLRRIEITKNE